MTSVTTRQKRLQPSSLRACPKGGPRWFLWLVWVVALTGGCSSRVTVHRTAAGIEEAEVQGEVRSTTAGILCPSRCTFSAKNNDEITLEAHPAPGWVFLGWEGGCAGEGRCAFRPREDTVITARFSPLRQLRLKRTGLGQGIVDVAGPCRGECERSFPQGTRVTLRALPAEGSRFVGWEGACGGPSDCVVILEEHHTVTARFEPLPGTLLDTRTLRRPPQQLGPIAISRQGHSVTVLHEQRRVLIEEHGSEVDETALSVSLPAEEFSTIHALVARRDGGYFLAGAAERDDCVFARADELFALKWRRVIPNCGRASHAASISAEGGTAAVIFAGSFGSLGSTLDFEGRPLRTRGARDIFVARYGERGTLKSVHVVGSSKDDELLDLAAGSEGEVALSWCGGSSCFLTLLDAEGNVRWEHRHAKTSMAVAGLDFLRPGVVAVGGEARLHRGSATVFGISLAPAQAASPCGASKGFVALLDGAEGHARALVPVGGSVLDLVARMGGLVAAVTEKIPAVNAQALPRGAGPRRTCEAPTLRLQAFSEALDFDWRLGLPTGETATEPQLVSAEGGPLLVSHGEEQLREGDDKPRGRSHLITRVR